MKSRLRLFALRGEKLRFGQDHVQIVCDASYQINEALCVNAPAGAKTDKPVQVVWSGRKAKSEEAWKLFARYEEHILGVISDVDFKKNGVTDPSAGIAHPSADLDGIAGSAAFGGTNGGAEGCGTAA